MSKANTSISPKKGLPSPFLTRRTRTYSATRTANDGPMLLVSFFSLHEIKLSTISVTVVLGVTV